jgi:uncharacterized protein DUF3846
MSEASADRPQGLYLKADGATMLLAIAGYDELRELVGGYIEPVYLDIVDAAANKTYPVILWVDEDGIMKKLQYNALASMFANVPIMGNAVLLGINTDGDSVSIPQVIVNEYLSVLRRAQKR